MGSGVGERTLKQVVHEESEIDKFERVHKESQRIGRFLDWLFDTGIVLARFQGDDLVVAEPSGNRVEKILAAYYDIDLEKLDRERAALLAELRAQRAQEAKDGST